MQTKKLPRILMLQGEGSAQSLAGLYVIWPDRAQSEILDISFSGMLISSQGLLSKVRLEQSISLELRIPGVEDTLLLKARVVQIRARTLGFIFESISSEGRLTLDQHIKDRIVAENLRPVAVAHLASQLGGDVWLHGPFDTNVILWNQPDQPGLRKALIEYDNLIWNYEGGEIHLQRSSSAVDEAQGYFNTSKVYTSSTAKVSMGASWPDRLLKVLDQVNERTGSLTELTLVLRQQRGH